MPTYETTGLWKDGSLTHYTSPGSWTSGLSTDNYDGGTVYMEYQPVMAVFDIDANTITEIEIDADPIRNGDMEEGNTFNSLGELVGEERTERPRFVAGYEVASGAHKIYTHYVLDDDTTTTSVLHTVSTSEVLGTLEDGLSEPSEMIVWNGGLAAVDDSKVKKI